MTVCSQEHPGTVPVAPSSEDGIKVCIARRKDVSRPQAVRLFALNDSTAEEQRTKFQAKRGRDCSSLACEAIGSTDSYESYRLFPSQGPNDSPSSPGRLSRLYYTMTEVIHAQLHSSLIYRLTFRI
jgi:hypothetical protein